MPALAGMAARARRVRRGGLLLACATPMLLYTGLTGFVDVAAAGAGIWAFVIYTDQERPQSARGILTGALLTLVFLLRRYFFFFTVSFGLASLAALACDYLIVAAPIQYHLGEENQHLVTVLAQPVLEGTGIGTAYRRLDVSFPLQDGVTVYVYERTRDIAPEEYRAISAELTALYPEYAAQYHSPV